MIALTGANGQLGRLVLSHLATLGAEDIRALVRTPAKAADLANDRVSVVAADYNAPETLAGALQGVDRLLLISGSEIGQRSRQHAAIIEAAKQAGVSFIVYTSILNADTSPMILAREHRETEALLKASGINHAVLRNSWYIENYESTVAAALAHGAVVGSSGEGRIAAAGRGDYAEAAARVLTGSDTSTRVLELAGSKAFTLADLAAEISKQTGRDIPFQNLPQEVYAGILVQAGLPQGFADILADSDTAAAGGALFASDSSLEALNGHASRTLSEFVKATLA